ncbi:hypothetical protein [Sphingobium sp. YBL2]|nr:hypothetical protein [Sphingobium sp. YBL2]
MDGKPPWQDYLTQVRAVIAAIREPSGEMLAHRQKTKPAQFLQGYLHRYN